MIGHLYFYLARRQYSRVIVSRAKAQGFTASGWTPMAELVATDEFKRVGAYFHDFFWTGRHVVFHLHPTPLSPLPMLMGFRTFVDGLSWRPDLGSLLLSGAAARGCAPVRAGETAWDSSGSSANAFRSSFTSSEFSLGDNMEVPAAYSAERAL